VPLTHNFDVRPLKLPNDLATITRRVKTKVEHKTGLPLSDTINVLIFLLTLGSYLFAAAGIFFAGLTLWISIRALKDANDSGNKQLSALSSATDSLQKMNKFIEDQQNILAQNLETSRQEQAELANQISVARSQLELLQAQNDREIRKAQLPEVNLLIACSTEFATGYPTRPLDWLKNPRPDTIAIRIDDGRLLTPLRGRSGEPKFRLSLYKSPVLSTAVLGCHFSLTNSGKGDLQNGYLSVIAQGPGKFLPFSEASEPRNSTFTDSDSFIDLIKNRTLFGNHQNKGTDPDVGSANCAFKLTSQTQSQRPQFAEEGLIVLSFKYGGQNYQEVSGDIPVRVIWRVP
jgi:hypothetical protein